MFDERPALDAAFARTLGADARIYCEPTQFVARPQGLDGRCLRLAGGMLWFAAWRIRARSAGAADIAEATVAVEAMDAWTASLPEALAGQVRSQVAAAQRPRAPLTLGERTVRLDEPRVVGIINATPDSFATGAGTVDADALFNAGYAMASAGAAIIDVGGESTRPGAPLVWEGDEIARVQLVVERLARAGVAVSIDTRKAAVMEAAYAAGARMINDISALGYDERALSVAAATGAPVVLMHAPSQTSDPHAGGSYAHVLLDVYDWLRDRIAMAEAAGLSRDRIVIDPGIGFGKGVADNLTLTNGLALFQTLGCAVLYGASRKRFIGAIDGEADVNDRLGGSLALHLMAIERGAQLVRVHDVREMVQVVKTWRAMRDAALMER